MEISTREHVIRIQILEITGRLDAFSVTSLRQEQKRLIDAKQFKFVVDLSKTAFMDSAGMSALVSLLKQSRQSGGDVVLVPPADPAAYRILTLTRFDQVFTMAATIEQAIARF